jgi:hypothetical protein
MAADPAVQQRLLAEVSQLAAQLNEQESKAKEIRIALRAKMVETKDAGISSYAIAIEAHLSQPRVMQIIKGAKEAREHA